MKDLIGRKVNGYKFKGINGETGIVERYNEFNNSYDVVFSSFIWRCPADEIEKYLVFEPKRGDVALFSDDNKVWEESIFLESHDDNRVHPFTAVKPTSLWKYKDGKSFWTEDYAYMKRIEAPTYTIEQLKEKVGNFKLKL